MFKIRYLFGIVALMFVGIGASATAQQLSYGRYFGTIQMNGHPEVMAVSLDAFIMQIDDPTVYPELNVILRANLGGYVSPEYVGYNFYDPTYDFDNGVLQLNDPKNDLTATLQVSTNGTQTILQGTVTYRPTNAKGTIYLATGPGTLASSPYLSVLAGEYKGTCGRSPADLQIETGRGLGDTTPGNALLNYSITGRLGFTDGPECVNATSGASFCSAYPFAKGIYNLYGSHLTLQGPLGTLNCSRSTDTLQCTLQGQDKTQTCQLAKVAPAPTRPVQTPTGIFIDVPPSQKSPLPAPLPPGNDALIGALNGDFYGFLHYENRDVYQLMQMSIVASTSTENPHVQNQVLVEPTISLRLDSSWDAAPIYSVILPQRVFYMNTGFSFQADDTENFVVIGDWRSGWLSGVMYSRTYGRVGTFELVKGSPPPVPSNMKVIPNCIGQFVGPQNAPSSIAGIWTINIGAPNQTASPGQDAVQLLGRFQLNNPASSVQIFDASALDLNTGALSFLIKKPAGDRLVTGQIVSNKQVNLLWPVGPALGAPMESYNTFGYTSQ